MDEKNTIEIKRRYIFTLKELKEKLGIKGTPKIFGLWAGRSPKDREKGVSEEKDEYFIETIEVNEDAKG